MTVVLHPAVAAAAAGELPAWARAEPGRRQHMARVAGLLDDWAGALGLAPGERQRWCAVGYLHDALRNADPEGLRDRVAVEFRAWPAKLLHGPAAAEELRRQGVDDEEFLTAVTYHTVGHSDFGLLGRGLHCADYLEPARADPDGWRASRRAHFPDRPSTVTFEVVQARIRGTLDRAMPVQPETNKFWNLLVEEVGGGKREA